ncbi:MAG: pirin family protein [Saprospiraceae bacterium]|nr:pirin family protein [Saprospiraceae bacterium]
MQEFRTIEKIIPPPKPHMVGDGFRVHHFFPGNGFNDLNRMSPFFMLDYNSKFEFSPSENPRGVGVHPHRGFETVSISFQGKIAHHDSAGNHGIIQDGDVQWMTAGSGVLHKEYHEKEFSKQGGIFHMAQLWVNLPAQFKMTTPRYQEITKSDIAIYPLNGGIVEIIAGEYQGVKGPAKTFSPVLLYKITLQAGGIFETTIEESFNCCMLIIEGEASYLSEELATQDNLVLFKNDGHKVQFISKSGATMLFMAGEPIHEPIAAYGPFVMNTEAEIQEAFLDFRNGKFGYLDE